MKLKDGFVLKEIAGECVVVPTNADLNLDALITLNSTAKTLWICLDNGAEIDDLVSALLNEYEVDEITARQASEHFVNRLKELDLLA